VLQAVELLNQLLFSDRGQRFSDPLPAHATAACSQSNESNSDLTAILRTGSSGGLKEHAEGCSGSSNGSSWWRRDEEFDGPDLSGLSIPACDVAGLGLKVSGDKPDDRCWTQHMTA